MDAEQAFRMLDTSGKGSITKEDFISQWTVLQKQLSPEIKTEQSRLPRPIPATSTRLQNLPCAQNASMPRLPASNGSRKAIATAATTSPSPNVNNQRQVTASNSRELDAVFFKSFDLNNEEDLIYSPAKPQRYALLEYNWSITPVKNKNSVERSSTSTEGLEGDGAKPLGRGESTGGSHYTHTRIPNSHLRATNIPIPKSRGVEQASKDGHGRDASRSQGIAQQPQVAEQTEIDHTVRAGQAGGFSNDNGDITSSDSEPQEF